MSADRLRAIREAATPGPWHDTSGEHHAGVSAGAFGDIYIANTDDSRENARLIALAPDLAEWAADAADALRMVRHDPDAPSYLTRGMRDRCDAVLARLADLVPADPPTRQ